MVKVEKDKDLDDKPSAESKKSGISPWLWWILVLVFIVFLMAIAVSQKWINFWVLLGLLVLIIVLASILFFVVKVILNPKSKSVDKRLMTSLEALNFLVTYLRQHPMKGGMLAEWDLLSANFKGWRSVGRDKKVEIYHISAEDSDGGRIIDGMIRRDDPDKFSFIRMGYHENKMEFDKRVNDKLAELAEYTGEYRITRRFDETGNVATETTEPLPQYKVEESEGTDLDTS